MFLLQNFKCHGLLTQGNLQLISKTASLRNFNQLNKTNKVALNVMNGDIYGQPTSASHPHLINDGDLTIAVGLEEFQIRRQNLMNTIREHACKSSQKHEQAKNSLIIIPSSTKKYMSDKIPYVFRQNSDFFYLTGCLEPDTILTMAVNEKGETKSILFMRPKDQHAELWDGARTGVSNAIDFFGVDEAFSIDKFEHEISNFINTEKPILFYDAQNSDLPQITNDIRKFVGSMPFVNSPTPFIHAHRLLKSPAEQALMRQTCDIASAAINEVIGEARPGHSEHHLFAMVDFKCRMRNASHLAYPPVVASGLNATTIHYISNTQIIKSGDLVLMDAGCEYGGYSSDITRTWPISGSFTEAQKVLYDVILLLQKELIDTHLLKEGGETLDELFETMCMKLGKYLQEVGLVPKDVSTTKGYAQAGYKFCPHHVSHYLGMDVHDTPLMPRSLKLSPGMVFTVEPGIYIGQDCTNVPTEFRGLGVRIEDDILVTADNKIEVLTAKCLKERSDLENKFKEKR